jgi:ribosomal protein S18 acetylase RimI-like enzyme
MVSGSRPGGEDGAAVRVRRAAFDDGPATRELLAEVAALHVAALPHLFRAGDQAWERDEVLFAGRSLAQLLDDPNAGLLVAEADGVVIGVLLATIEQSRATSTLAARRYLHVQSLAVRAEWRRIGAGRALLDAAHAWAKSAGVTDVELHVWEFNQAALAFYETLGYATLERRMGRSLED